MKTEELWQEEEDIPDEVFFIDRLNPSSTGIDAPIWISCENSDRIPAVKAEVDGKVFSLSITEQAFLSDGLDDNYFEIPTYVLRELQMWIRLNQRLLLDYWYQEIDTFTFCCLMIRILKHSVDVSRANLSEKSIFPIDKFKVEVCSTDSCRPHFHIVSREEGYDIRVDVRECFLIHVDRYGKRGVNDSFSDVISSAKEWLNQRPANPKIGFKSNKENLFYLWESNHC